VIDVELVVAALHRRFGRFPELAPAREFFGGNVQVQGSLRYVQFHHVAIAHETQRTAGRRLGRGVQHDRAVRRAAHARIRYAHHVLYALRGKFFRDRQIARFRHGRRRVRTGILQHEDIPGIDIQFRVVDAGGKILKRGEHDRLALMFEQAGVGGRPFEDRALRRKVSEQRHKPALRLERLPAFGNDRAVDPSIVVMREALAERLTRHRQAIEMEQVLELAHQRAHPAAGEEVFHVAVAHRFEVHKDRRGVRQFIEALQRHRNSGAAGDRRQVNNRIGGAADGKQDTNCILNRCLGDDAIGRQFRADELDRHRAGRLRRA